MPKMITTVVYTCDMPNHSVAEASQAEALMRHESYAQAHSEMVTAAAKHTARLMGASDDFTITGSISSVSHAP